jgi:hypothetical protein
MRKEDEIIFEYKIWSSILIVTYKLINYHLVRNTKISLKFQRNKSDRIITQSGTCMLRVHDVEYFVFPCLVHETFVKL